MNIEQAKALKVGDEIVLAVDSWDDMRIGISYKVTRNGESKVGFIDDVGDTRYCKHEALCVDFTLPPQATPTQWIPFDKERMSEAIEYRKVKDKSATLEKVTLFDNVLAFENDGQFDYVHCPTSDIEMLVPVVVKYPCLCRSVVKPKLVQLWDCESLGWTPLTTAELAEIGLKQIS